MLVLVIFIGKCFLIQIEILIKSFLSVKFATEKNNLFFFVWREESVNPVQYVMVGLNNVSSARRG